MSIWLWVIVGIAAFFFLSVAVSLAVAAVLGRIGEEVTELLETELWSTASLNREETQEEQEAPAERSAASAQAGARRPHR
jgi:hypothetical protein